jgi:hypothetical protein
VRIPRIKADGGRREAWIAKAERLFIIPIPDQEERTMKTALAVLIVLASVGPSVAGDWPSCSDVPKCPDKDGQKRCCDEGTQLVWQRDGCKAEQWSVLSGDPEGTGPFVIRFRWSQGVVVPPHVHPVDEHVTVIRGVSRWGMGKTVVEATTWRMTAGMFSTLPKMMAHYAIVEAPGGEIQIHGYGPFETYWVDTPCEPDPEVKGAVVGSPRKAKAGEGKQ